MALKADRHELDVDISFFYNEGTAERGGVVVLDTVGSGAAMDQAGAKVKYAAATNALIPVGILLNDVVNLDLTRQHINWHQDEVQKGGKVSHRASRWGAARAMGPVADDVRVARKERRRHVRCDGGEAEDLGGRDVV